MRNLRFSTKRLGFLRRAQVANTLFRAGKRGFMSQNTSKCRKDCFLSSIFLPSYQEAFNSCKCLPCVSCEHQQIMAEELVNKLNSQNREHTSMPGCSEESSYQQDPNSRAVNRIQKYHHPAVNNTSGLQQEWEGSPQPVKEALPTGLHYMAQ